MRLSLPRMTSVFTSTTPTLKSASMAPLIWILLASFCTSKMTWFCFSRSRVDFSVSMMGRRMMCSGCMALLLPVPVRDGRGARLGRGLGGLPQRDGAVEAASLERLGGGLGDDQVIVPEE